MPRDLVTDMKHMERVVRGCTRHPDSPKNYSGPRGRNKRPYGLDPNLGGDPLSCSKCGLVYRPRDKKDAECPFCDP